jgi:opacity protein-like surface antigen
MKKMFLMASLILTANLCSAQFIAITTIDAPKDSAEWEMSNVTGKIGIGYMFNDNIAAGLVKNGEEYALWGRYYFKDCYAVVQAPTEEMVDNMTFGIGYSFKVWEKLYVDPNYMMSTKENSEGKFKIGISYKL